MGFVFKQYDSMGCGLRLSSRKLSVFLGVEKGANRIAC